MNLSLLELSFALAAGGLTTLSPCVLPILPLVVGSAGHRHRYAPLAMAAGLISAFVVLGVLVGLFGDLLGFDSDVIRLAGAWLLIAFGVVLFLPFLSGRFANSLSPLASIANRLSSKFNTESMPSAFVLGSLLGMVWSPCSGPLLASTLTLVASEGGALRGAVALGVFGLGAAIPLVGIAYASRAGVNKTRGWVMQHVDTIKKSFAVLLILLGAAILAGWDKALEAYFVQFMPDMWVQLTTMF
ncbi:cytochrome c biogenesis CcdA family protein [Iodobacter ciconiae]|uniref:Cytochrome c biogenesis protein CcdA n=1 Tax=Iodobacter ciconiae TaxID=2496266 RepID=A0A3S8ZP47_9NEIS|nr:cytochrome c biogenesis CcdA family protein [Iodobacter ciconiae]AZN35256.1 cytochrome c biogenesis protein CcdA [Iodobacter ciconiae]